MIFKSIWDKLTGVKLTADIYEADELIMLWKAYYSGKYNRNYDYSTLTGRKHTRTRMTMNTAKVICSELARLVWSENPIIKTDQSVLDFLDSQNFYNKMSQFTEYGAALGGFALKLCSLDGVNLKIDYVPADCFLPVSWDNNTVTEADFIDTKTKDGKNYIRVEKHRKVAEGYMISFEVFQMLSETEVKQVEVSILGIEQASTLIKTSVPLFSYISTSEANNVSMFSPLGVSIYANALDTLKSIDIAFDALSQEIILGKKRIIVPDGCVKTVIDTESGKPVRYFDPSDEVYQAFKMSDVDNLKITDNTTEIRIEELRLAIQTLLNILAVQIGFSTGSLSFDGASMKTATEVISENSKTFKTKQAYENQIGTGILILLEAIRSIGSGYGIATTSMEYGVGWNDSIIEDRNSKTKYWLDRLNARAVTLEKFLISVDGMSESEADAEAQKIRAQNATVDVNSIFNQG